jgi:hypothetical protein
MWPPATASAGRLTGRRPLRNAIHRLGSHDCNTMQRRSQRLASRDGVAPDCGAVVTEGSEVSPMKATAAPPAAGSPLGPAGTNGPWPFINPVACLVLIVPCSQRTEEWRSADAGEVAGVRIVDAAAAVGARVGRAEAHGRMQRDGVLPPQSTDPIRMNRTRRQWMERVPW